MGITDYFDEDEVLEDSKLATKNNTSLVDYQKIDQVITVYRALLGLPRVWGNGSSLTGPREVYGFFRTSQIASMYEIVDINTKELQIIINQLDGMTDRNKDKEEFISKVQGATITALMQNMYTHGTDTFHIDVSSLNTPPNLTRLFGSRNNDQPSLHLTIDGKVKGITGNYITVVCNDEANYVGRGAYDSTFVFNSYAARCLRDSRFCKATFNGAAAGIGSESTNLESHFNGSICFPTPKPMSRHRHHMQGYTLHKSQGASAYVKRRKQLEKLLNWTVRPEELRMNTYIAAYYTGDGKNEQVWPEPQEN